MIERKLAAWQEAGLIDAGTTASIRAYEAEHSRPLALWAVVGIGALAIGLGLVSVVAANWEAIPGTVRLAAHFALLALLAAALWWRGGVLLSERPWVHEALLFVFAVLGLTFFGHLGQVYQTSSPLWQPLALWLALFAPVVLLRGSSWLAAALLAVVLVYACWDFADPTRPLFSLDRGQRPGLVIGISTALPVLLAPLGAWMRGRSRRTDFWRRLEQLGFAYALGCASLIAAASGLDDFDGETERFLALGTQIVQAAIGLGAAALVIAARRSTSGRAAGCVIGGAALVLLAAHLVDGSMLGGAILFMALWVSVAFAALQAGWRRIFQLAVAVIAVRLVILSFELASDLLTSGAGLIAAGLLILAVAWIAVRVSRRLAPPEETAP